MRLYFKTVMCLLFLLSVYQYAYSQGVWGGLNQGLQNLNRDLMTMQQIELQRQQMENQQRLQEQQLELQRQRLDLERQQMEAELEKKRLQNEELRQQLQKQNSDRPGGNLARIQANWIVYGQDAKGTVYYYDPASFSIDSTRYVTVREKLVYPLTDQHNISLVWRSATVDCVNRNYRLSNVDIVDRHGQRKHVDRVTDWHPIAAGTGGTNLADKMCERLRNN